MEKSSAPSRVPVSPRAWINSTWSLKALSLIGFGGVYFSVEEQRLLKVRATNLKL
jgi:hypothetical protein